MRDILLLILFQSFWAGSYVGMKLALDEAPLGLVMILRIGIAFGAVAACGGLRGAAFTRRDRLVLIAVGLLVFSLSPFFQLSALQLTLATDAALLVAFEPVTTALLAVLILRERLQPATLVAFLVATIGVLVMSDPHAMTAIGFTTSRLFGNGLFLLALICEGIFSITTRTITQRHPALPLVTRMLLAGLVGNVALHYDTCTLENLRAIDGTTWVILAFLGICCTAWGYTGWAALTKRIPVNRIALSLFLQPFIGGAVAYVVLGEMPTPRMALGGGIVLTSLLLWTWHQLRGVRLRRSGRLVPKMGKC